MDDKIRRVGRASEIQTASGNPSQAGSEASNKRRMASELFHRTMQVKSAISRGDFLDNIKDTISQILFGDESVGAGLKRGVAIGAAVFD